MKKIFPLICLSLFVLKSFSQTVTVGSYAESVARMNQLLGVSDDLSSFTQHPINSAFNSKGDSSIRGMVASKSLFPKLDLFGVPIVIKALPFNWLSDYNSKLPFGYNNGPLYPNVGYQTMISGGIFIKAGILNIQFKPELVHAENAPFATFADVQANYKSPLIPGFFNVINGIDAPERFGPYGISYAGLGQSKITLSYKNIEAGVSTENMWWGPGVQNSIMMSNSAPGFLHWTFNSANPIKTIIGSFEWQVIGGILKQSGYAPYDAGKLAYGGDAYYIPKPKVNRYISAFTANWHPKWIDGLYLGVSGYDYMNKDTGYNKRSILKKYFPVFSPSSPQTNQSVGSGGLSNQGDGQDYAYAVNIRQVLSKYNAEIYFEYARNDQVANLKDFILEPEHSSAYTFGGSRLFNLPGNQFFQVKMELTHLQVPASFLVRAEPSWYVHITDPRDGYTNEGRYIGAGIGPGSNSLMLDLSYIRGLSSFGIKFERYVHDQDLYYSGLAGTTNFTSNWVDLSSTFYANMKFKKYLIALQYTPITTYNYEYLQGSVIKNTHARINLTYFFD
ncbi:MAG: hypothetical protein JWQ84_2527 [Mucilaginibacter sp.]|nr:hypothetical protein [Mucilaginibacter sp.]